MTLKTTYNIVKCGHSGCEKKNNCPHYGDHQKNEACKDVCTVSDGAHKCYDIIEQRKIKLKKLETNDRL